MALRPTVLVEEFFFRRRRGEGQPLARHLLVRSPPGLGKTKEAMEWATRYQTEQEGKDSFLQMSRMDITPAGARAQVAIFVPRHELAREVKAVIERNRRELGEPVLRRGLELGGWWPYALALVDAGLAAVVIAALALAMTVGIQAFDALAVHGGGTVLPLEPLFDGIAAHPSAPEYWWLYALLLSTMIPSLVNLIIGGTSLVWGLPGVPSLLLRYFPERGGVLKWDRHWIATVLTAQIAAGAALGIAAQAFLVVIIIGYIMPFFGLELLDMARDVAAFNLPARVGQLFGVSL